jgi:DNA-binding XRE family transcriptional regulator
MGNKKLLQWRRHNKVKQKYLAELLKVSPSAVSQIESGKKHPSLSLALDIQIVTGGKVPVEMWRKKRV